MKYYALLLLPLFLGCVTPNAAGLVTDGPTVQEGTCDIAGECCDIDGERVCCLDNGARITCWKDRQVHPEAMRPKE